MYFLPFAIAPCRCRFGFFKALASFDENRLENRQVKSFFVLVLLKKMLAIAEETRKNAEASKVKKSLALLVQGVTFAWSHLSGVGIPRCTP